MEHHSMSAGEFKDRYGVTPQEVQDALDENRRRVARKLSEWGYGWAVDEVMCDVAVELLKGGLRRWASYEDRKPLGAFVNTLLGNRLGEWMRTERPKYRGGMAYRRRPATGAGERRIQGRHEIFGERMRATGSGWSDIVADAGTPMSHRDTWRRRIAR